MKVLKIIILVIFAMLILLAGVFALTPAKQIFTRSETRQTIFAVQAIDTMKYSRDRAREKAHDKSFDAEIDRQMQLIKEAGATHASIATPYDKEFTPFLKRWVDSARRHGLSVWFRGNFSGWEGWFDYPEITRSEHLNLTSEFITQNPDLFEDGDIFSPCPECENGGSGDPRETGDRDGYRKFLIGLYSSSTNEFKKINKDVSVYFSMNGDIARDIILPETAKELGGVILIDHYVSSAKKFSEDVDAISNKLSTEIGLGEFGAPIPDLNGNMTEAQQANYISALLLALYDKQDSIPLVSYWTLKGGTTEIIDKNNKPKEAYGAVQNFFAAKYVHGSVLDPFGFWLRDVKVMVKDSVYSIDTGLTGSYQVFLPSPYRTVLFEKEGYNSYTLELPDDFNESMNIDIILEPIEKTLLYKVKSWFYKIPGGKLQDK